MIGGTGLALLISAWVSSRLHYPRAISSTFILAAVPAIIVALYRSNKFDEYIAAASAVIARAGRSFPVAESKEKLHAETTSC